MIHGTQSNQISQNPDEHNIYAIMKTMCPPVYHHNGFVTTHALEHMMYGYTHICMYIYTYVCMYTIYIYVYIYVIKVMI